MHTDYLVCEVKWKLSNVPNKMPNSAAPLTMSNPIVGLVGSRRIETELQNTAKKTVVDFAFPANSRTPNQIGLPREGKFPNPNSLKTGDCYKESVESTALYQILFLGLLSLYGTYMLQYVQ